MQSECSRKRLSYRICSITRILLFRFLLHHPDLRAGLYRDYVSGRYVLSKRDRKPALNGNTVDDWYTNIRQG